MIIKTVQRFFVIAAIFISCHPVHARSDRSSIDSLDFSDMNLGCHQPLRVYRTFDGTNFSKFFEAVQKVQDCNFEFAAAKEKSLFDSNGEISPRFAHRNDNFWTMSSTVEFSDKPVNHDTHNALFDSLEFSEFSKKISNIFAQNKIKSIISKLPAKFKIYGYDIGDINNDNSVDIVLSARDEEDKGKLIDIYFFLNQGDSFSLVKTFQLKYYGQPIEVAFSIEKGVCYITRKVGEYHWNVSGYKIENNIFHQIDKWETLRLNIHNNLYNIGYDTYDNFEALKSTEHFYRISDNKTYLKSSFYSLPVYPSHRHIPKLFPTVVVDTSASNILSGSSSWFGKDDLSFTISARYDSAWLFLHTEIEDDQLFNAGKPEQQDTFELWFDISGKRKVDATYSSYVTRDSSAADVFGIKIAMGDQKKYSPSMSFISGRLKKQQASILSHTTFSVKQDTSGKHVVDIKLPIQLFTLSIKNGVNAGFTAAYRDLDNPLHPEWITTIATSDDFLPGNPKTFGILKFINEDEFYGDVYNLNINLLVQRMRSAGLM